MDDAEPIPEEPRLTPEERLSIENKYLRLQNAALQMQLLDVQLRDAMKQRDGFLKEMRDLEKGLNDERAQLSTKYGVAITRETVDLQGVIRGK